MCWHREAQAELDATEAVPLGSAFEDGCIPIVLIRRPGLFGFERVKQFRTPIKEHNED